jgi:glyoxylase-like metal-dependent hydrolase (beta-lactamase superfamily II)
VEVEDHALRVEGASGGEAVLIAAAARELREETGVTVPLEASRFVRAARTVTPAWANLRYDATYFLVELADLEPDVSHSGGELTDGEWVTPAEALAAWRSGARLASPVVMGVLRGLASGWEGAVDRLAELLVRDADQRLWELAPGMALCMLRSPTLLPATHTNCWVLGARELIVIDPGSPYPEEQEALDAELQRYAAQGRRVREIWVTHHHRDHVSGVAHLAARCGASTAAHPITIDLCRGQVAFDRPILDGELTVLSGDGEVPERRLRAVHTPGHTAGHHVYFEESTGFLVAGDMVAGLGTVVIDPVEGDMAAYLASLERMKSLSPRVLLPAHGQVLASPLRTLDEYTRHRLWREARVLEALRRRGGQGRAGELVPLAYDDVPPSVHPLAERSLVSHLIKLEKEGRVTGVDGGWRITGAGG